jgi:cytochrome c-type biogenesis protein CcmF
VDSTVEAAKGDSFKLGAYQLTVRDIVDSQTEDYVARKATVEVSKGGAHVDTLHPERRFYKASQQGVSEVAIRRRLNEDLYLNFAGANDPSKAVIQAYIFPLVSWIWIGFWILAAGTVVCLIPSKVRLQYARTEVVGISRNYAEIQK